MCSFFEKSTTNDQFMLNIYQSYLFNISHHENNNINSVQKQLLLVRLFDFKYLHMQQSSNLHNLSIPFYSRDRRPCWCLNNLSFIKESSCLPIYGQQKYQHMFNTRTYNWSISGFHSSAKPFPYQTIFSLKLREIDFLFTYKKILIKLNFSR